MKLNLYKKRNLVIYTKYNENIFVSVSSHVIAADS